jgi:hypothetical protein
MHLALALLLILEPPRSLSPEAAEHNTQAMQHYDAGRFGPAVDEFHAAYRAMPDARRDREGRELLLGSMRAALLDLHAQSGEPAPLCRLRDILAEHIDALTAAHPGAPDMPELRSARARHEDVSRQLTALGPTACEPPPPPATAAAPPVAPASSTPTSPPPVAKPPPPDIIPPRHLDIAGGVTLVLGGALLGATIYGIFSEASARSRAADFNNNKPPDCPLTAADHAMLQDLRSDALAGRRLAIGAGISAGVTLALAGTLLGLARRSARANRWSAAPWWSPTGAGLALHVRLGPDPARSR